MKQPLIVFRTNGSGRVGLGHVRRCLTLAQELRKRGALTRFVVKQYPQVVGFLGKYGFDAVEVEEAEEQDLRQTRDYLKKWNAQALVLDSYTVHSQCFANLGVPLIAVIDDMADRPLPVDLVINGAANATELHYQVLPKTRLLLGLEFALLREEFAQAPERQTRERVERVLITVGGADSEALTVDFIGSTRKVLPKAMLDVVVGPFFSGDTKSKIDHIAKNDRSMTLHADPPDIRALMVECDLAVAGGGQTTYELAATGTPAIAVTLADNQTGNVKGLSTRGTLLWVGRAGDNDLADKVTGVLRDLVNNRQEREAMSWAGRALVDGRGTKRVAQAVLEACPR